MNIKLSDLIAPHFHKTFNSKKVHQIDEGGRGSTKTSKNALKVVQHVISDPNCNVVGIRRYKGELRQSIFAETKRAFTRLGMREGIHYKANVSPMKITYFANGNTIYFGGLDDHEKLKGMIADDVPAQTPESLTEELLNTSEETVEVQEASIKIVWMSEITQIKDEDDILQTVATFSRGDKDYFVVLYEYNPPKNKFHWINKWTEEMSMREDALVTHSSYLTVPRKWLGEIFIQQAEELKKNDEDRYKHIYLGEVTGLEGLIYNYDLINIIDELEEGEKVLYIDIFIDTGHQTSATTYLCVGVTNKGKIVLLDTYFYSPNGVSNKKAPSEFSKDLWDFLQDCCDTWRVAQDTMIIDSAEGGMRNQFKLDYGMILKPVAKKIKEDMIDIVQNLLSTGRFYVLNNENNKMPLREHRDYEWKEGSVEAGKPEPDKTEKKLKEHYYNSHSKQTVQHYAEHTCDGLQYGTIMNMRKYGLKI